MPDFSPWTIVSTMPGSMWVLLAIAAGTGALAAGACRGVTTRVCAWVVTVLGVIVCAPPSVAPMFRNGSLVSWGLAAVSISLLWCWLVQTLPRAVERNEPTFLEQGTVTIAGLTALGALVTCQAASWGACAIGVAVATAVLVAGTRYVTRTFIPVMPSAAAVGTAAALCGNPWMFALLPLLAGALCLLHILRHDDVSHAVRLVFVVTPLGGWAMTLLTGWISVGPLAPVHQPWVG